MPKTETSEQLMSTAEVATLKGVHPTTVNRWVQAGRLPIAHKAPGIRGANLYRRADVEALVAARAA